MPATCSPSADGRWARLGLAESSAAAAPSSRRSNEVITLLAKAEAECGRLGEGLANLDAQPAVIEQREQRWSDAEVDG